MKTPPTAVLLHAYPLCADMWHSQREALEEAGYSVVTPNLPGFGGTPGAISSLSQTARELLSTLPPQPLTLLGLSMGGYLALELLAQAPQRFGRVVLADTSCRADDAEKQKDRRQQAERVLQEGSAFIVEAAAKEHPARTFEQVRPMIEAASREGIAGALRAMAARPDHCGTLARLSVPLLVLVGEKDELTPPDQARTLAEQGRGRLEVLPGAGHLSNLDHPEAFNRALLDFLPRG